MHMNPLRPLVGASLALALVAASGCHVTDHHHEGGRSSYPIVESIGVVEYDNVGSHLEVEVHLYNADTDRLIGCAGDHTGLAQVDESGVVYRTSAWFVSPYRNHERLSADEIDGRDLYVRVFEDDLNACPTPVGNEDDFIGQSGIFAGEDLFGGIRMSFDDVLRLDLGIQP